MTTQSQKSSRNRKKGGPQLPKGEASRHSANQDRRNHPATPTGERSRDTSNGSGSTPGSEWLLEELRRNGTEKPRARFTGKNIWECRDGNRKLGVLAPAVVDERNAEAVAALFSFLRASVTLELETSHDDAAWNLLWATADALSYGQRQIVFAMMRAEKGQKVDGYHVLGQMTKPPAAGALDDWCARQKDPGRQALRWGGSLRACAAKAASDKAKAWLGKEKEQADKSPPWFKAKSFGVPEVALALNLSGRELSVSMHLLEGSGWITLPAHATGASAWSTVRKIVNRVDGAKYLAGRCVYSDDRRRWLLKVSYLFKRPEQKPGVGVLAVLPSFASTVELYGSDGWRRGHRELRADGARAEDRLFVAKRRISQRRGAIAAARALPGSGARGHGKKRFMRSMNRLRSAEDNLVTTYCGQAAADVVRLAQERGYGEIIVADYDGGLPEHATPEVEKLLRKFPRARLRDAVKWKADKAGLRARLVELSSKHVCPACGSADGAMQVGRVWFCHGCGLRLEVGDWQAWRVFRNACGDAVDEVFRRRASQLEHIKAPE
jgi:transposase